MSFLTQTVLNVFFPKTCQHCGDFFKEGLSNILCRRCFDSIFPYADPVCDHCGASLPPRAFEDSVETRCRDCGEGIFFLDQTRAFGVYAGALRIAHHSFKFEGMEHFKKEIAGKMLAATPRSFWSKVEALTPVPQSPERERERGFNPAFHIADEISRRTQIPNKKILNKVHPTKTQMSLARNERFKNPKGAYRIVDGSTLPARIVLVDDVFTTGSTLEECAKILKMAGVQWVGAVVFGRTPHR